MRILLLFLPIREVVLGESFHSGRGNERNSSGEPCAVRLRVCYDSQMPAAFRRAARQGFNLCRAKYADGTLSSVEKSFQRTGTTGTFPIAASNSAHEKSLPGIRTGLSIWKVCLAEDQSA
jgi:hypothetical protein